MPAFSNYEQVDTCHIPAGIVLLYHSHITNLRLLENPSPSPSLRSAHESPHSDLYRRSSAFSAFSFLDTFSIVTNRMARTKTATGHNRGNGAVVVKNRTPPAVRFADMRANTGQRFSIAGAKMSEKMAYFRANVMLMLHRMQHRSHPVKRVAATESVRNMKAAATERRRQKVARAVDNAASKRAQVRERRAIAMARHA